MKKIILTLIVSLVMISNAHAGLFSKKPILVCTIEGEIYTFNLKKWDKEEDKWIEETTDQYYNFGEMLETETFTRLISYTVDRYSGVVNGWMSYQVFKGESGGFKKLKTPQVYFKGTCKGVK